MQIKELPFGFSICKVKSESDLAPAKDFYFTAKTDEEISLVCQSKDVPPGVCERDDGWRGFRIEGTLDFSLIGILAKISALLAQNKIGIFAVSTYNTDYIFTKEENFKNALRILSENGYSVE